MGRPACCAEGPVTLEAVDGEAVFGGQALQRGDSGGTERIKNGNVARGYEDMEYKQEYDLLEG